MTGRALRGVRTAIAAAAVMLSSGCASTASLSGDPNDPWESANRASYAFNDALDRTVLGPAARWWSRQTRPPATDSWAFNRFHGPTASRVAQAALEPITSGTATYRGPAIGHYAISEMSIILPD